jgi:hypothetical protein
MILNIFLSKNVSVPVNLISFFMPSRSKKKGSLRIPAKNFSFSALSEAVVIMTSLSPKVWGHTGK